MTDTVGGFYVSTLYDVQNMAKKLSLAVPLFLRIMLSKGRIMRFFHLCILVYTEKRKNKGENRNDA